MDNESRKSTTPSGRDGASTADVLPKNSEREKANGSASELGSPAEPKPDPNNCGSPKLKLLAEYCQATLFPGNTLVRYAGEYWQYEQGAYKRVTEEQLRVRITDALTRSYFIDKSGNRVSMKDLMTPNLIRGVMGFLVTGDTLLDEGAEVPQWRGVATHPPASEFVSMKNGLLHIPTRTLRPHDSNFFTTTCLPFAYDPEAPVPTVWLDEFLKSSLPGEEGEKAIKLLGEWFGYCITPDMRHHKMLYLNGKVRSGKGTVLRTLEMLLGKVNVCSPTIDQLSSEFGLSSFIGKRVAMFADATFPKQQNSNAMSKLLSISGNDGLDVNRKHMPIASVRLNTKIVIASNEVPNFKDPAGALASRLLGIDFPVSFLGKEDRSLEERILPELPGIFNWALEGHARLEAQGKFTESQSIALEQFRAESNPVGTFIAECCQLIERARTSTSELYNAWRKWCDETGFGDPRDEAWLGRELRKDSRYVERKRSSKPDDTGKRPSYYVGIALLPSQAVTA